MAQTVKRNFPVQGMGCAACVARVEKALKGVKGVEGCSVSLASNTAQVDYRPQEVTPEALRDAVQAAGYDLIVTDEGDGEDADDEADRRSALSYAALRRDMVAAVILALVIMAISMGTGDFPGKGYVLWALATPAVFWCGRRFIVSAWRQLKHGATGMDTLVALSILISYLFSVFNLLFPEVWTSRGITPHLYFESSSMIGAFILIGRTLEDRAKHNTTAAVRELAGLQPKTADIHVGDVFTVKPGERIAADGVVVLGSTYIDESMLTGEPVAALKRPGDKVYTGTINQKGSLEVRAEKVGSDTMLSAIIRMVKDAQGSRARIQSTVDKVASVFVPVIIGISIVTLLAWILLAPDNGVTYGLLAMVSVLVIACPCSLGLATPTALTVGIGNGARHGILIKDADSLQVAGDVDVVVMDKTGTLTKGRPEVTDAVWLSDDRRLREVLLGMEQRSEHPLASAVVAHLHAEDMSLEGAEVEDFENVPGRGVRASFEGREYFAGNEILRDESSPQGQPVARQSTGIPAEWAENGCTVIMFSADGQLIAAFAVTDEVKDGSAEAVAQLKALGVESCMLTGDNAANAEAVASKVGISHVRAGVLPGDKASFVRQLQSQGHKVAMIGDGINDSAALASADLSVAMGRGSDIAINAAMVTIVSGDLRKVAQMIRLSRKTVRIIRQNLFWAFFYNVLAVPVAAGVLYPVSGFLLNPMVAAACMALSSVCVVTNSLRLRR